MVTNPPPLPKIGRPGIAPAVRPFVMAALACAVVIILFSPAGIIYDNVNLSFLVAPLLSLFIIGFLSKLSAIYLPGYSSYKVGMAVAGVLNGLAYALFFFLFLDNAPLLTRMELFTHIQDFLTDLSKTAGYVVLFITGLTVSKLAEIIRETASGKFFFPIINALGQFFAGLAIWQFLAAFSPPSGTLDKIGLMFFAGIFLIALSNIGQYGVNSKNPFITDASRWLTHSLMLKFFIGAFIAAYILFIRPAIISVFSYAAIVEWLIVCFIGWRLFSGIKNGIRLRCAVDVYETDWKKHIQLINNLQGAEFPRLREIQDIFTSEGSRATLVIYLTLLLYNNKESAEEIHRILHPLIDYEDEKIPWFAFGWEQRRILKHNEAHRRLILSGIMASLKYIMSPASQKIEEQTDE